MATLDVLSGGRAVCGLGAAWFEEEHRAYGWPFPPVAERLDLVADALELLPLLWGPGAPAYRGRVLDVPEAACYPRPLQERVPIIVGGQGERRTLRLVAERADGCNLFGDPAKVRAKLAVLHAHCADVGRDPAEIEVTHLSTALAGADGGRGGDADGRAAPRPGRRRRSTARASVRAPSRSRSSATARWRTRACRRRSCGWPMSAESRMRWLASRRSSRRSGRASAGQSQPGKGEIV